MGGKFLVLPVFDSGARVIITQSVKKIFHYIYIYIYITVELKIYTKREKYMHKCLHNQFLNIATQAII